MNRKHHVGYIRRMHDGNLVDIIQILTLRHNVSQCDTLCHNGMWAKKFGFQNDSEKRQFHISNVRTYF